MRTIRFGPQATAAGIRALTPKPRDVEDDVRMIIDEVRAGGDDAVRRLTERFDRAALAPESLLVPLHEIESAASTLEPAVLRGLRTAIANVRAVAEAALRKSPVRVELPERQVVEIAEVPVRRAAAYVPGGRAPYPSTVAMCAVTAQTAGVDELAVCAPPGPEGRAHPTILAACASRSSARSACSAPGVATTTSSLGPARPSMPTTPLTCRFASVTYAFPGPTITSTGSIVSVP